jgi:hypothetical protein
MQLGHWSIQSGLATPLFILVIIGWVLFFFLPIVRIVQRMGHSGWWSLLVFVPPLSVVGLWVLAYGRWPALDR